MKKKSNGKKKKPASKAMVPAEREPPNPPGSNLQETEQNASGVMQVHRDPVGEVKKRVEMIEELYRDVLKEDVHYGIIPGCKKPSLWKPGAEMIVTMFQLAPKSTTVKEWLDNGHMNVDAITDLYTPDGIFVARGEGSCSTLETKYRYRHADGEDLGPVPQEYWQSGTDSSSRDASLLHGGYAKKTDQGWRILKRGDRVENDNIADTYNTVKKMGVKRSLVASTLNLGASAVFTQDTEGMRDNGHNFEKQNGSPPANNKKGKPAGTDKKPPPQNGRTGEDDQEQEKFQVDVGWDNPMPFGKFKGKNIGQCPSWYLEWLMKNCTTPGDVLEILNKKLASAMMETMKGLGINDSDVQARMQKNFGKDDWNDITYEQRKAVYQELAKELQAKKKKEKKGSADGKK